MRPINLTLQCVTILGALAAYRSGYALGPAPYPYRAKVFDSFVMDSFKEFGKNSTTDFYRSFESAFAKVSGQSVQEFLRVSNAQIRDARGNQAKVTAQIEFARKLHLDLKRTIPKFSLDRGFEFFYTTKYGERQCFLQSVLIASLMQKINMDAGVAMVYRNERGEPTNNGHAVTLVRLLNGKELVVDASEPTPFARHRGLFVRWTQGGYRYIQPQYALGEVPFFSVAGLAGAAEPPEDLGLDVPFLRSQFDYYRGERAQGGFLAKHPTPQGLSRSIFYLTRANHICPDNPLVQCVLGFVQEKLGQAKLAARSFHSAELLYQRYGWIPGGLKAAMNRHPA